MVSKFPGLCWDGPEVFRISWWAGHYGAPSPKPHIGFCNNVYFQLLDRGTYKRVLLPKPKVKTVKRTISKSGKVSYCGTKQLKSTQLLFCNCIYILSLSLSIYIYWPSCLVLIEIQHLSNWSFMIPVWYIVSIWIDIQRVKMKRFQHLHHEWGSFAPSIYIYSLHVISTSPGHIRRPLLTRSRVSFLAWWLGELDALKCLLMKTALNIFSRI